MRKRFGLLVVSVLSLGVVLAACSAPSPTAASPAKPRTATPAPGVTRPIATASGVIADVDVERLIIVMTTSSGKRLVLSVATDASITADGAATTLTGIRQRIGSRVIAMYMYNAANNIAYSIQVSD